MPAEKKLWKNCNRFSEKLGQKILQLGLNGQKLARKSEVSDSEISRIMNGKSLPGLENAIALARAVDVSLDYLADDSLDADPNQPQESAERTRDHDPRLAREIGFKQAEYILGEYHGSSATTWPSHRLIEGQADRRPVHRGGPTRRHAAAPAGRAGQLGLTVRNRGEARHARLIGAPGLFVSKSVARSDQLVRLDQNCFRCRLDGIRRALRYLVTVRRATGKP